MPVSSTHLLTNTNVIQIRQILNVPACKARRLGVFFQCLISSYLLGEANYDFQCLIGFFFAVARVAMTMSHPTGSL